MKDRAIKTIAIYMHDLSGGGAERQALKLVRELRRAGMDVTLVLHSMNGDLQKDLPSELPVHLLGSRRTIGDIPKLAAYLRERRPDVLLANVDHNNVAALLAKALARSPTHVVICQHNALSASFSSQLRWTYRMMPLCYRALSPLVAGAVAVSSGIAEELRRVIAPEKVRVIHNAVIGNGFAELVNQPVEHPWFGGDGTLFVTAGRLVGPKDHETMIRAFAQHYRRNGASKLMILGVGPLAAKLRDLCLALGVEQAVGFLGFQDNPLPYFRAADCFVLSSNSEGFGNVLVEALGCGTPIISTDCPHGPAEILEHGRFGVLTRTGDVDKLAEAMDMAKDMRITWKASELQLRAAEFSDAACAMKYIALFNELNLTRKQVTSIRPSGSRRL